ncbi:MAG: FAD-dependent oxidoreductase [Pacificimonas sp.]
MTAELARFDCAIVGSGHAGAAAALALRQYGYQGTIGLIGDEPDPPYERPPLSKEFLADEKPFSRMLMRKEGFWEDRGIARVPSTRIETVDADAKELTDAEGETIHFETLIWAAGGEPRSLPCGTDVGLAGVHAIRTHADVQLLKEELATAERIVVIGGGYIGLEAAAVLVTKGKDVTVVEAENRLLARVAGSELSAMYLARHEAAGVSFRMGVRTDRLEGDNHRVVGVHLTDGDVLPADLVIVGIGIVPSVQPLFKAGAAGGNGVKVDAQCRTSLADIFAIGDCALHENTHANGAAIRLESVQNANDMAKVAARTICGQDTSYDALPWFWSNQYELKLQTAGLSAGHDTTVVRGDPATFAATICYLKNDQLVAVDCVNQPKDFVQGQRLISARRSVDLAALADANRPLKELLTA